jgi:predicted nucleic acid-binding protein
MYLLDTNILLELLLKRRRYAETEAFLRQTPWQSLKISDFSLYFGIRYPASGYMGFT